MSRNYELLTHIEYEQGGSDNDRPGAAVSHPIVKTVAAGEAVTASSREMLRLVQSVFLSRNGSAPRQVVFCGVNGESGSSFVCASAGRTLASSSSRSVCLVDANLRSPRLSGLLGVDAKLPVFGKSASVRDRCIQIDNNLWLAGPALLADDCGALPSIGTLKQLLTDLCSAFEYVLIDAPGTNVSGDAATLGQVADATVLIIEADDTRRLSARRAKETLDAAGARLVGAVLNNRSFPIPEELYRAL